MAVETTPLGFQIPNGDEPIRGGDNVIANNGQKAQDILAVALARIGVAEAALDAGAGGVGLSEDPVFPGLYYFAGPTITADPDNPGLYTF